MNYQEKVQARLYELRQTAKNMFKVDVGEFNIKYDLTYQNALGMVKYKRGLVSMRLNRLLLEEDAKLYIDEVLCHEFAHLIVSARFPDGYNGHRRVQPHGKEFKAVCRAFGIDGKSTTEAFVNSEALKVETTKTTKTKKIHYYKCSCGIPKQLSTVRHNKVQRGTANYSCGMCYTTLSFIKST